MVSHFFSSDLFLLFPLLLLSLSRPLLANSVPSAGLSTLPNASDSSSSIDPHHRVLLSSVSAFGSCSFTGTTVNIFTQSDFSKRLLHSNTTAVILVLQNDIKLTSSLVLDSRFSCTVVRSRTAAHTKSPQFTISYPALDSIALQIQGAANILFFGVNVAIPQKVTFVTDGGAVPLCPVVPEESNKIGCPAIHLFQSYNIQITSASISGRIDIRKCAVVTLDYLLITAYGWVPVPGAKGNDNTLSKVRVMVSGDSTSLLRSSIRITNNVMQGISQLGVYLFSNTVGVLVSNNRIMNSTFASIQCGCCFSSAGDCMMNTISNNWLESTTDKRLANSDGAGIYMDLKWTNPGNLITCNYIIGGAACIYWDVASSGTVVTGGVCLGTGVGFKINHGKANLVTSLIMHKGSTLAAAIGCIAVCHYNCNEQQYWQKFDTPASSKWLYYLFFVYNTTAWQTSFPWTANICSYTSILGVPCNPARKMPPGCTPPEFCKPQPNMLPPYSKTGILDTREGQPTATWNQTGGCSGLPYLNYISVIGLDGEYSTKVNGECCGMPSIPRLNSLHTLSLKNKSAGLNNVAHLDYGASNSKSPIYKLYPGFVSCPKSAVGPQTSSGSVVGSAVGLGSMERLALYAKRFNRRLAPTYVDKIFRARSTLEVDLMGSRNPIGCRN